MNRIFFTLLLLLTKALVSDLFHLKLLSHAESTALVSVMSLLQQTLVTSVVTVKYLSNHVTTVPNSKDNKIKCPWESEQL